MSKTCLFFLIPLVFFFLSACKKDSTSEDPHDKYYNIRFKFNGVQKEFKSDAKIEFGNNGQHYINATAYSGVPYERVALLVTAIPGGVNVPFSFQIRKSDMGGRLTYVQDQNTSYLSLTASQTPADLDFKLQVTEKNDQFAKGTFSGTVLETVNLPSAKKASITEGTFYLEIKK